MSIYGLGKQWGALDGLHIIWKSNIPDEMKREFFRAIVESVLMYGSNTWTLTKRLESKRDGTYTRMLAGCPQYNPGRNTQLRPCLHGHLPPITDCHQRKANTICWTLLEKQRRNNHCCVAMDPPNMDILELDDRTGLNIKQICEDIGCQPEDLPHAMEDRADWRRASLENPCNQHNLMIMMMMNYNYEK